MMVGDLCWDVPIFEPVHHMPDSVSQQRLHQGYGLIAKLDLAKWVRVRFSDQTASVMMVWRGA